MGSVSCPVEELALRWQLILLCIYSAVAVILLDTNHEYTQLLFGGGNKLIVEGDADDFIPDD